MIKDCSLLYSEWLYTVYFWQRALVADWYTSCKVLSIPAEFLLLQYTKVYRDVSNTGNVTKLSTTSIDLSRVSLSTSLTDAPKNDTRETNAPISRAEVTTICWELSKLAARRRWQYKTVLIIFTLNLNTITDFGARSVKCNYDITCTT